MSKLRWNCKDKNKCFVVHKHVKLEVFDDCFRYGIQSCDIDGITEIGGHLLIQEWKDPSHTCVTDGQNIMFKNMTKIKEITVIVVYGDARTMTVEYIDIYESGLPRGREKCNLLELKKRIKAWAERKYTLRKEIMNEERG